MNGVDWVLIASEMFLNFEKAIGAYLVTQFKPQLIKLFNATMNAALSGVKLVEGAAGAVRAIISGMSQAISSAAKSIGQIGVRIGRMVWNTMVDWFLQQSSFGFFGQTIGQGLKKRAAGFHGFTTGPTLVGERAIERVDVTPMSDFINRKQSGGGTGMITVIVPVMLDRKQIAEVVASEITVDQAVYR
jgi:hypothetical protein